MVKNVYVASVSEWHREPKEGKESLQDERKGCPSSSRAGESEDTALSARTGINRETVRKILVGDLTKKKGRALILFLVC
jgi:hypothetical protein